MGYPTRNLGNCRRFPGLGNTGFTLVELLVVVAIIALLISILLPSLKRAQDQARSAACMSNMKQTILAMHMYTADNKGRLPGNRFVFGANSECGLGANNSWLGLANWDATVKSEYSIVANGFNVGAPGKPRGTETRHLWDWIGKTCPRTGTLFRYLKDPAVYLCPSDKRGLPESNPNEGGGNGVFSYTMNYLLGYKKVENCRQFKYKREMELQSAVLPAPIPAIPAGTTVKWSESDMPLLFEEHPWNNTNQSVPLDNFSHSSYISIRHNKDSKRGRSAQGYLDGHVKLIVIEYRPDAKSADTKQGVDFFNELRFPYDYKKNAGGAEAVRDFIVEMN